MGPADASRWSLESDPEALLDHPSLQPDRIAGTNIFLSSAFTEGALEVLRKHGITHILQVGFELEAHHPEAFMYCLIPVADRFEADIVQYLPEAFDFISQGSQDGRVLVHCVHGQSRSAAVVIAFLMWKSGQTYDECFEAVRACRPRVQPNSGFEMQLRLLEQLGFDISKWPGWTADTYAVARQQQLLRQSSNSSQQLLMDAQQQQAALTSLPPLLLPEQQQLQQQQVLMVLQQQQQQPQLLQQLRQQQQQQQVGGGGGSGDSEQQDLVILTSPLPSPSGACAAASCSCGKGTLRLDSRGSINRSMQLDVAVDIQQEQQQKHSKDSSQASGTPRSRRQGPACCTIM